MNIKKGLLAGALVATLGVTSLASVYAKADVKELNDNIAICTMDENYVFNFKEFSKEFKDNISKQDYKKAEKLFNKAIKLEDDAYKYWDELYKLDLFDTSIVNDIEPLPFENIAEMFKKDITTEIKNKAEKIYSKIVKFEKEGNFDEAIKLWEELDSLDVYDIEDCVDMGVSTIENMSFEEFSKNFKKDIKPEDKKKAKQLYEKAVKLEKENKINDAIKVWDQLFSLDIFDKTEDTNMIVSSMEVVSFEEFAKGFKKDLSQKDKKKAKQLYEKALKLEQNNKMDEAIKVWDQLFEMNLFDGMGDIEYIDGGNVEVISAIDGDIDIMNNEDNDVDINSEVMDNTTLTFDEFSKGFKKGLKPEIIKKAKELFAKANSKEKEAREVWDEIYKMNIFKVYTEEVNTKK
ncbi:tetratricopeptide repeat protein [Vallitalea sp.]|uniref:tetratricopeptide repeat protein n=1 Tax=Vallitalea sp. TaxID=1882829 RepID=UPI0025D1C84A|nr:hypothetical protein [Vallitalea sp.]MCT4688794.1 hypothetical protein [Vallitalea sp.]